MAKTFFLPGFRFHPTDDELISYYLKRKVMGKALRSEVIADIELYKFAPWDLPDKSCLKSKDLEWFFFCPRDKKYGNGSRINRATDIGFWKTTGKDKPILHNACKVGMRKTLVFHTGKAPHGERTDWLMHEYRLEDEVLASAGIVQDAYVLCKIFQKSGLGPKNGEQHGAPFKEEDWETDMDIDHGAFIPFMSSPEPVDDATLLESVLQEPVESKVGEMTSTLAPTDGNDDLFDQILDILGDSSLPSENANGETSALVIENYSEVFGLDEQEIYNGLEDLSALAQPRLMDVYLPGIFNGEPMLLPVASELGSESYVELNDMNPFMGEGDPFGLVASKDTFMLNPFGHHPSFENMSMGFSTLPVDNGIVTGSGMNDSLPKGPDTYNGQFASTSQMGVTGRDTNLLYDLDVHPLGVSVGQAGHGGSTEHLQESPSIGLNTSPFNSSSSTNFHSSYR